MALLGGSADGCRACGSRFPWLPRPVTGHRRRDRRRPGRQRWGVNDSFDANDEPVEDVQVNEAPEKSDEDASRRVPAAPVSDDARDFFDGKKANNRTGGSTADGSPALYCRCPRLT